MQEDTLQILEQLERVAAPVADLQVGVRQACALAEVDPEMALTRCRKVLDFVIRDVFSRQVPEAPGTRPLESLVHRLIKEGHLPPRVAAYASGVRELGNVATHDTAAGVSRADVIRSLGQLVPIIEWYVQLPGVSPAVAPPPCPAGETRIPAVEKRTWRISLHGNRLSGIATLVLVMMLVGGTGAASSRHFRAWARSVLQQVGILPSTKPDNEQETPATPTVPGWLKQYPAGQALALMYEGTPPAVGDRTERLRLQVALFARRVGEPRFRPLPDGGELASESDQYLIVARPGGAPGHLYILQVDATTRVDWLFPQNRTSKSSTGKNPVAPGQIIQVPPVDRATALTLDATTGVEHVYVVLSAARWPALEEALARAAPAGGSRVKEPIHLDTRGVGDEVPIDPDAAAVVQRGKERLRFDAKVLVGKPRQGLLVVERWFRHVDP
jgi:hypothetical protein